MFLADFSEAPVTSPAPPVVTRAPVATSFPDVSGVHLPSPAFNLGHIEHPGFPLREDAALVTPLPPAFPSFPPSPSPPPPELQTAPGPFPHQAMQDVSQGLGHDGSFHPATTVRPHGFTVSMFAPAHLIGGGKGL